MTPPAVARVLVADDHAVVRHGLRLLLDREPDLTVIAEAADGAQAVDLATNPATAGGVDLVILDIAMPRLTGLQAARELARRRPHLPMLMLSMYDNDQFLFEALKAGASGYVLKSSADRDIVTACRAALTATAPTSWTNSVCATGSSSPATPSAAVSSNRDHRRARGVHRRRA
jgi:DNA-binding NarL/FixJ family response regulator